MDVYSLVASQIVVSGCPGQTVCAPEDPDFDAFGQDTQTDYWSPSGSLGVQYGTRAVGQRFPRSACGPGVTDRRCRRDRQQLRRRGGRALGARSSRAPRWSAATPSDLGEVHAAGDRSAPASRSGRPPALRIEAALDVEAVVGARRRSR